MARRPVDSPEVFLDGESVPYRSLSISDARDAAITPNGFDTCPSGRLAIALVRGTGEVVHDDGSRVEVTWRG